MAAVNGQSLSGVDVDGSGCGTGCGGFGNHTSNAGGVGLLLFITDMTMLDMGQGSADGSGSPSPVNAHEDVVGRVIIPNQPIPRAVHHAGYTGTYTATSSTSGYYIIADGIRWGAP